MFLWHRHVNQHVRKFVQHSIQSRSWILIRPLHFLAAAATPGVGGGGLEESQGHSCGILSTWDGNITVHYSNITVHYSVDSRLINVKFMSYKEQACALPLICPLSIYLTLPKWWNLSCLPSLFFYTASDQKLHRKNYLNDRDCMLLEFQGPLSRWIVWLKKFENTIIPHPSTPS